MLMRICGGCGKAVEQGQTCPCRKKQESDRHKQYDRHRRARDRADFYNSKSWRRVQAYTRQVAGYKDELVAYETGRYIEAGTVHHILPLEEHPEKGLDLDNLILVSPRTHRRIHIEYERDTASRHAMTRKLQKIVRERQMRPSDGTLEDPGDG